MPPAPPDLLVDSMLRKAPSERAHCFMLMDHSFFASVSWQAAGTPAAPLSFDMSTVAAAACSDMALWPHSHTGACGARLLCVQVGQGRCVRVVLVATLPPTRSTALSLLLHISVGLQAPPPSPAWQQPPLT